MNVSSVSNTPQSTQSSGYYQSTQTIQFSALISKTDTVSFGQGGQLSTQESINIVTERAYAKLRSVVDQARADLGLSANDPLDTSAEATGNRIADFALGAFDKWLKNHELDDNDESRQAFVDFIGGAVQQGIDEASGILEALQALTPDAKNLIQDISNVIQQRFDAFLGIGSTDESQAA